MIKGKSLVELAQMIQDQKNRMRDFIVPSKRVRMLPDANLEVEDLDRLVHPNNVFHSQLATKLEIPSKYYLRMRDEHPELLAKNVNTWLTHQDNDRMFRTFQENGHLLGRAFLSNKFRTLDNYALGEVVLPILHDTPGIEVKSSEITERRLYIQAVNTRLQGDVKVGDAVQAGIMVSNSEVGFGNLVVAPLLYVLHCLNGQVSNELAQKTRHLGRAQNADDQIREVLSDEAKEADDRALFLKLRDLTKASLEEALFTQQLDTMREAAGIQIESKKLDKVVEVTGTKLGLTKGEGESVLQNLINGQDLSKWGLANAITRLANDHEDYDRAMELERAGGKLIELPKKDWASITAAA